MFQYRQVLVRLRAGDTTREIARSGLMGRDKAGELREVVIPLHLDRVPQVAFGEGHLKESQTQQLLAIADLLYKSLHCPWLLFWPQRRGHKLSIGQIMQCVAKCAEEVVCKFTLGYFVVEDNLTS